MTGHNHYRDCTCGWCISNGRTTINRIELKASYRIHEAEAYLKRNGARSIAGCYVNPNAKCPVCGAAVFFYANAAGSRVYFDDLGPPWPKHPCTDNHNKRIKKHPLFTGLPMRRAAGITHELVEAARTSGSFRTSVVSGERWLLLVLVAVNRSGTKNTMLAEHLTSDRSQRVTVKCNTDAPIFDIGDYLSMRGNQFSFFDKISMSSATFINGGRVVSDTLETPALQRVQPLIKQVVAKPIVTPAFNPAAIPGRSYDMTTKEMAHFHSKRKSVQQLCDQMLPIVRSYSKSGIRKPRQVSEMLNKEGHRTLLGEKWTPRLTYFLLGLVFMPREKPDTSREPNVIAKPMHRVPPVVSPMTMEDIAARLSNLGRVVLPNNT